MIKSASVSELKDWLDAGHAMLVDVREPDEYQAGHIKGSTLMPLAQISLGALPPYQRKKLVMQCRSGGRSRTACTKLIAEQPDIEIYNLEGGFLAWKEAGYEVSH